MKVDAPQSIRSISVHCTVNRTEDIFAVSDSQDSPMAHTRYKLLLPDLRRAGVPGSNLFLFTSPRDLLYVKQM